MHSAFTIVELLIVIVVIAILSSIIAVLYMSSQSQASDTQMRDALDKFSDSISLWSSSHNGKMPFGGYVSTGGSTYDSTAQNCTNATSQPATRWQDAGMSSVIPTAYACTIGDVLINTGYLPSDFFTKLPQNPKYTSNLQHFMVYTCTSDPTGKTYLAMASLTDPTNDDNASFQAAYNACFTTIPNGGTDDFNTVNTTYNMRIAKKISF